MIAAHIVFGCYGFWPPNDPRGSWSTYVGSKKLYHFAGPATKVNTRHSRAHDEHDVQFRHDIKSALKYPPVVLTGRQALAVSHGFRIAVDESRIVIVACSIMPDHVHLVVQKHTKSFADVVAHLKSRASKRMNHENQRPMGGVRSPWSRGHWEVWLDSDAEVFGAIEYVERNPIRDGLRPQCWPFVVPYR